MGNYQICKSSYKIGSNEETGLSVTVAKQSSGKRTFPTKVAIIIDEMIMAKKIKNQYNVEKGDGEFTTGEKL